jgi:hypothetical protein
MKSKKHGEMAKLKANYGKLVASTATLFIIEASRVMIVCWIIRKFPPTENANTFSEAQPVYVCDFGMVHRFC